MSTSKLDSFQALSNKLQNAFDNLLKITANSMSKENPNSSEKSAQLTEALIQFHNVCNEIYLILDWNCKLRNLQKRVGGNLNNEDSVLKTYYEAEEQVKHFQLLRSLMETFQKELASLDLSILD